jgi:predicted dehydrogenase
MATRTPQTLSIGILGYAGVARAHLNALKKLPYIFWPTPVQFRLVGVAGRSPAGVDEAARRYGFAYAATDWRRVAEDPQIDLLINCSPNDLHREPCLTAAASGKHLLCEKPLGRDAGEAKRIWDAVRRRRGLVHQVSFNYRFIPAVRLAREMIQAGELGDIVHFRMRYTDDSLSDPRPHASVRKNSTRQRGQDSPPTFWIWAAFSAVSTGASAACPGSWCRAAPSARAHVGPSPWTSRIASSARWSSAAAPWGPWRPPAAARARRTT